jgi:hypothetical protein
MNTIRKNYTASSKEEFLMPFLNGNSGIISLSLIVLIVSVCLLLVGILL